MIPLYRTNTDPAPTARLALDNLARPTVNSSSQQRGIRELGAANKQTIVDGEPFVRAAGAMGAIGQALQETGSIIGAAAAAKSKAENDTAMNKAQAELDIAGMEIAAYMEDPRNDPATFEKYATQRRGQALQTVSKIPGYNKEGQAWVSLASSTWDKKQQIHTQQLATKRAFSDAADSFQAGFNTALYNGDYEGAQAKAEQGYEGGYFSKTKFSILSGTVRGAKNQAAKINADTAITQGQPPEVAKKYIEDSQLPPEEKKNEIANIEFKYAAQVERSEFHILMDKNPAEAMRALEDPEKFTKIPPAERLELKQVAEYNRVKKGADEAEKAAQLIDMIDAKGLEGATLDKLGVKFEQATPYQRYTVQQKLLIKQGKAQMNDEDTFGKRMAQAMAYTPESDPNQVKGAQFEMLLEQEFSGPMLERLKGELDKRRKGEVPAIDPGPALALMEDWTEQGALGQYKVPVMVNGKPVMKDPTKAGQVEVPGWLWGTNTKDVFPTADGGVSTKEEPLPVTEIDKVKEARVAATKKQIREQLEKEIKVGKLKSNDEVSARMVELFTNAGGKVPPKMATEQPSLFPPGTPTIPPDLNKLLDTYAPKSR